ncbi:MAG: hypothetical protein IPK82_21590 [Polyangiaceae bacterium]|nr:hypothetical protein [Polyangiaceae bacterium]
MYTRFHLSTEALPETTRVVRVSGTEGVNQLPEWKVRILCPDGPVNVDDLLCAPVTLEITDEAEESMRLIELVTFDVAFEGKGHDGAHYELTLSAPVAQLKLRSGFKTFLDKKVDEIVKEVLTGAGTPDDRLVFRLSGKGYEKRPYCVHSVSPARPTSAFSKARRG